MIRNSQRSKLSMLKYLVAALFITASCILAFYPLNSNAADYPNEARFFYSSGYRCVSNFNNEQPGYCADFSLAPDKIGQWEYKKVSSSHSLDYMMYHGADGPEYQQHHTILGVKVDNEDTAHLITQLSVWSSQGIKTGSGLDENFSTNGKPSGYYTGISQEYQDLCKKLVKKALEYENKGPNENDPEYKCSRLYKCDQSNYQRFVTYYSLGNLKINKTSSLPDITNDNNLYNLENTYFHIYQGITWDEAKDTGKWMKTTTEVNEDGKVVAKCVDVDNPNNDFISLKNGAYWLVEEKYEGLTNKGYIKQSEPIKVYIFPKQTTYASNTDSNYVENTPEHVNIETLVEKYAVDADETTSETIPLNDVKFEINYYDCFTQYTNDSFELPQTKPVRSWIFLSDSDGIVKLDNDHRIGGDPLFTDEDNNPCVPRGTITIQEIEAPNLYKVDDTIHVVQVDKVNNKTIGLLPVRFTNSTKRSDLSFTKIDATTQSKMSNIPFKITNTDTNESHIFVTDKNGCINTSSSNVPHSHNTNINDNYVDNNKVVNEEKLTSDCGVWFNNGDNIKTEISDYVGALPYGKYTIEELRCSKNINMNCQPFEVKVEEDKIHYCFTSIENNPIVFTTKLTDEDNDKFISEQESAVLKDEVHLSNLSPNTKYKLVGTLHVLDNDKDIGLVKDESGNDLTVYKDFETTSDTSVNTLLQYNVNTTKYKGKKLVSCVELYNNDNLVATHDDINDINQTVSIPNVDTYATNNSRQKNVEVNDEAKVIDEVGYKGLIKNKTYSLVGKIYNLKDTSEPIETFENTFIAKQTDGKAINATTINTSELMGENLVLTEELYFEDNLIAKHENFSDTKQIVHIPKLSTAAKTDTGIDSFNRTTTKSITDTVKYENLIPKKEYKIVGSLVNVDISKTSDSEDSNNTSENSDYINSAEDFEAEEVQTTEVLFTPEKACGEVEIEFEVNERNYNDKIVVFDKLYLDDTLLINHDNIEDIDQTIYIPKITTKLSTTDGNKEVIPSKATQLIDIVEITNLPINAEYKAEGKLVILDKNGKEIKLPKLIQKKLTTSAPVVFEDTMATAELNYEIDTIMIPNHKIVSTVEIKLNDKTYVSHYDLNDENQTVKVLRNKKIPKTFDIFSSNLLIKALLISITGFLVIKLQGLFTPDEPQRQIY